MKAYDFAFQPISGERLWPISKCEPLLPPPHARKGGRPKRMRRKEVNEERGVRVRSNTNEIPRKGRKMYCTNYNAPDHNASNYKNPRVENNPELTRRRQQQRRKKPVASGPQNQSNIFGETLICSPTLDSCI